MIRYLKGQEKFRSRELWEEAFPEDSKSFDDYYFEQKLKDNRILVLEDRDETGRETLEEDEHRIDAMIHLNPYLLQVRGRRWRVDYLVGVATRKDRRHRGYMRRLLVHMMSDMRDEQMPFCFLMPADEAIYRPFGFTYIFRQPKWKLRESDGLERRSLMVRQNAAGARRWMAEIAGWMNRWLDERYQVYAVRDEAYLRRLADELASENGTLDVLYDGEAMVGIHSEWGLQTREQRLLYCKEAYREEADTAKPAIMARIISPEIFVRVVRLDSRVQEQERVIMLKLTDPLIPANQGTWTWHLNHEMSWMERCDGAEAELTLNIEELTGWLFGYEVPEAAKPYEGLVYVLDGVFLDEVV